MANPEHLEILKRGYKFWNVWRNKNPSIIPDLSQAQLYGERLSYFNLNSANLTRAQLFGASFNSTNLEKAILKHADLFGAKMGRVRMSGANLSEAGLNDADLSKSDLSGASLCGANLSGTNFYRANLRGTDFSRATIAYTFFIDTDLSVTVNLNSTTHTGPSSVDINTIFNSRGNIPEMFLRRCGVPEDFITYMRSLTGKAIEFYSCFISYSSKDEEFAKRLYSDLQNEGVRCWFAPEDLKIGEKFRVRIDESIRLYDKLLLVLSENSVASEWVEKEVETALEKEREQGKVVLFPVRLDDSVFEVRTGWAADVKRTRHVGDFREWKQHDSYRRGFERLMRDLRAEARREV